MTAGGRRAEADENKSAACRRLSGRSGRQKSAIARERAMEEAGVESVPTTYSGLR